MKLISVQNIGFGSQQDMCRERRAHGAHMLFAGLLVGIASCTNGAGSLCGAETLEIVLLVLGEHHD